jgi:protein tyrosine phosphatase (PTP) superfamily phosphohydrolase (DUF442 family)
VSARLTSLLVTLIFVYTTGMNIWERPEGLKISCMFIATIMFVSFVSRATRSTELRITGVEFSDQASAFIREAGDQPIRIIAHRPKATSPENLDQIETFVREIQGLPEHAPVIFLQVERTDASEFNQRLSVQGVRVGHHCLLHARSPMVSNSIAAILIQIGKVTGQVPHIYFKWREGNPVINIFRFLFLGEGDAAPLTHEVLRKAVRNIERRPIVHVS